MYELKEKYRILIMVILLAIASFLTYYFLAVLRIAIVFTHFFYIPIILAALWWKRKGMVVAVFLVILLLLSHIFIINETPTYDDVIRAFMFMVVAFIVVLLSGKIEKGITEHKQSIQALAESEAKFRALFDNVIDGILLADIETKKLYMANKMMSRMLGYSLEEIKNLYVSDIHPEKDLPRIIEAFEKLSRGEITIAENMPAKRKDGTVFYADISASQMNIAGKVYNIGIFRDISERKRNEQIKLENERLELANRTKNEFLAVMSHELRTPLNAILGFSELLKRKGAGELNEKQQRYADNVYSSGKHLLGIIDDILDLTRVESGKMEIIIEKITVSIAIKKAVDLIKEKAASRNIIIKKQIGHDIEFIETDPNRFWQVLNNLLDNAVKFSKPEGGTVTITAEKEGEMVKFKVSDTGIGIRDEDMGRMFQSFEQMDAGIARKYGGTGLGLAVSKKLVELMGGSISVESRYGEGSTFTFTLPVGAQVKVGMRAGEF
jgi:PAS domain S-box-containing protein